MPRPKRGRSSVADPKTAEALARRPESPPELAVVECDGGRIRTREPDQGPGVHLSGGGWRETKNACLIRATRQTFDDGNTTIEVAWRFPSSRFAVVPFALDRLRVPAADACCLRPVRDL
jgi:hypothetical protein